MDMKKYVIASMLIVIPKSIAKESTPKIQKQIYQTLDMPQKKDQGSVYYDFKISQEVIHQINTMCLDSNCSVVFSRSREDIHNTPLVMKGTRRHIGEYLGYDQYDAILKKYNNDTIPDWDKTYDDLCIDNIGNIRFPLIYDELWDKVPHVLGELLQEVKFAKYRDTLASDDTVMINLDVEWKRSFLYYKGWKLVLATYTTIGKWNATPRGFFRVDYKVEYKKSKKYNNAAMPYALHVTNNIFVHQWKVSSTAHSHGCNRLPWLYAEALYYLTTAPKIDMVYKAEKNTLDSVQQEIYDSLQGATPKMLIID